MTDIKLDLPLFQSQAKLVEEDGKPTFTFHRWWQAVVEKIQESIEALAEIVFEVQAAQQAAEDAQTAADAAQTDADNAQAAAEDAQDAVDAVGSVSKLSGSGVTDLVLVGKDAGTDATISIGSHTRVYSDDTTVSVVGDDITGLAYSTLYYIFYNDPTFAGGAVTYQVTEVQSEATQVNGRHLVGQVTTPAAGTPDVDGLKPAPPGFGNLA